MKDMRSSTPHFLRVARALAGVRGTAVPMAAITTVVVGTYCGCANGAVEMGIVFEGSGGATSSSASHGSGGDDGGGLGAGGQDGG